MPGVSTNAKSKAAYKAVEHELRRLIDRRLDKNSIHVFLSDNLNYCIDGERFYVEMSDLIEYAELLETRCFISGSKANSTGLIFQFSKDGKKVFRKLGLGAGVLATDDVLDSFLRNRSKDECKSKWLELAELPPFKSESVNEPEGLSASVPDTLNTMDENRLLVLWQNAMSALAGPNRGDQHLKAQTILDAIGEQWTSRACEQTGERHPSSEMAFKWPSTRADKGSGTVTVEWQPDGVLGYFDYRVGLGDGRPELVRRSILARVFEGSLPPVFSREYMAEWGVSRSATRLRKMAVSIAAFVRNAKRRTSSDCVQAISEWEADLKFLRDRYYDQSFEFQWPTIEPKTGMHSNDLGHSSSLRKKIASSVDIWVKPLVWEQRERFLEQGYDRWQAESILGHYMVIKTSRGAEWALLDKSEFIPVDSVDGAMAAAQDDHEKRILSVIANPRLETASVASSPDDIRAMGWTVASHNDYRLNGEAHTFWLFTKDGRAIKGEGRTDAVALNAVRVILSEAATKETNSVRSKEEMRCR